jgi:hypothetical protein
MRKKHLQELGKIDNIILVERLSYPEAIRTYQSHPYEDRSRTIHASAPYDGGGEQSTASFTQISRVRHSAIYIL